MAIFNSYVSHYQRVDGLTPFCGARVEFPLKIFPESASYFQTRQNLGAWPVQSQVQWRAADCVTSLSQPVWEGTYSKMSLLSCLWIVTIFTEMSEQRVKADRFEIWVCLFQYFQWLAAIDSRLTTNIINPQQQRPQGRQPVFRIGWRLDEGRSSPRLWYCANSLSRRIATGRGCDDVRPAHHCISNDLGTPHYPAMDQASSQVIPNVSIFRY